MKKALFVASLVMVLPALARAADYAAPVVIEKSPPPRPIPYRWTGTYVGASLGYSWGQDTAGFTFFPEVLGPFGLPASTALRSSGVTLGAQWGYNYQIGRVVIGTESDLSWVDRRSTVTTDAVALDGTPTVTTNSQRLGWFATTRARLGITPFDRLLIYATGGIAYAQVTDSTSLAAPGGAYVGEQSRLQVGWTAGAGAELALTSTLSARLEYLYYDLGGSTVVGLPLPPNPPIETHTHVDLTGQLVRAGLNYKIDWGAAPWATLGAPGTVAKAPTAHELVVEFGARYWYSSGRTAKDLFDLSGATMVSRLTYDNATAHAAESFARADHWSGAFVKGNLGIGSVVGGNLKDEDFPPLTTPYSATTSDLRDGSLSYGSIDVGYDFLRGPRYKLGAFVGYQYYHEALNAVGCAQTAGNPDICVPPSSDAILGITNEGTWHSVRLGLNGEIMVTDRLKLSADAAWLPYTFLSSSDTHWLRQDQDGGFAGATPETGTGHSGYQLEGIASYQVTDELSLGVGGRYWHMETTGTANFATSVVGASPGGLQPVNYRIDRYGGFVQAAFRF